MSSTIECTFDSPTGSDALTISRRASSSISGSPVSEPLALPLATRFGGGLDGQSGCPATGSMALLSWWLLRFLRRSGGCSMGPPSAMNKMRHCRRRPGGSRSLTLGQYVPDGLSLLLCRTAGQSSPLHCRKGRSGTQGHSITASC